MQIFLQNSEMKSNRAGLGCANLNKVPEDNNSFLTDKAKLALSKFQPFLLNKQNLALKE